jgi:uncharacterized protein (DUF697 family)
MSTNETQEAPEQEKDVSTEKTIRNHVIGSMGVGLIPIPIVDLAGITGVQLNMLKKLADAYDIPFSQELVKNILGSLVGGSIPVIFSRTFASLVKGIPIIGQTTGVLAMPILAGATTYAVGKVFVQHFASGGTFLTFNPEKVRDYYKEMLKEGQKVATKIKKSPEKAESA